MAFARRAPALSSCEDLCGRAVVRWSSVADLLLDDYSTNVVFGQSPDVVRTSLRRHFLDEPLLIFLGADLEKRVFRSLSTRILTGFLLVATLPVATVAVLNRWIDERATLQEARASVAEDAAIAKNHVEEHLAFQKTAVAFLASMVARHGLHDPSALNRQLQLAADAYVGFKAISVPDGAGTVVAATREPELKRGAMNRRGASIAGHDHFASAVASDSAIVSGVYRDSAASSSPTVTLSHSVRDSSGRLLGVIEASLDLTALAGFSTTGVKARRELLVDRDGAVIFAAVIALLVGVVAAILLAQQVRAPLRQMSDWLHAFDVREARTGLPDVPSSAPEELVALHDTVTRLAVRLHTSYQELQQTVAEKETLNVQLNDVLKELDARVAARTAELQEALRRAYEASVTKSRFLANMSHELRTPLNSVIRFSSVLLKNRSGKLGKQELEMQERIAANGRHLLSLINDILDISKIEAGHTALDLEECDVIALIHDTLEQLGGQIAVKPIQLRYEGPETSRRFSTDIGKLRQILINLVGNAVNFTEEGEVVVQLETTHDGSVIAFSVRDSGIGIPHGRLEAIFQPFEQADTSTSRRFGGTRLGLAISRSLSEMLGADLTVASELGVGSTFTVAFVDLARLDVTSDTRKRAREAVRGFLIA
ncbi:MAG: ATP-binding protein [Gemmatimonadaceae bacterium]